MLIRRSMIRQASKRCLNFNSRSIVATKFVTRQYASIPVQQKNNGYGKSRSNKAKVTAIAATVAAAAAIATTTFTSSGMIDNGTKQDSSKKSISPSEVRKHNAPDDCWVVINGYVYDLTDFIPSHPGGPAIIRSNAGKDVTAIFEPLHAPDVIEKYIAPSKRLGPLQGEMPDNLVCPPFAPGESAEDVATKQQLRAQLPHLDSITNVYDFENLASQILSNQAWAYYSSGSDDEVTLRENHSAYHRIFFKPRILVDVREIDTSTEMLGSHVDVPFYVSATALCKLGNPKEGEKDIARGCGNGPKKVPQMISTLASCSLDEILEAAPTKEQIQWFQLYVNSDRKITDDLIANVEKLGLKALFITVDAPSLGNREKDAKVKFSGVKQGPDAMKKSKHEKESNGASRALSKFIDPSLSWDDVIAFKKKTNLPIVIKGVQRVEDILKAAEIGVAGVVISNHGGRQLDFSRSPIEVLAEAAPIIKERHMDKAFELYVDGGVRRGTDIIKALCLGAKGVGLGRPFLYANSTYGKDGVEKLIERLTFEVEMSMRLLGVNSIKELNPDFLDLSGLKGRTVNVPSDFLYNDAYQKGTLADF